MPSQGGGPQNENTGYSKTAQPYNLLKDEAITISRKRGGEEEATAAESNKARGTTQLWSRTCSQRRSVCEKFLGQGRLKLSHHLLWKGVLDPTRLFLWIEGK